MTQIRAAAHVHSDWSYDGKWSLDHLAKAFSRRGYRVILATEHDRGFDESKRRDHRDACLQASSDQILIVPGIEYSDPSNVIHLLVWGDVPFVGTDSEPQRVLKAAKDFGGVVLFAHPSRKAAWKRFDPLWKEEILGIEFWNRKTDGWAPSPDAWALLESTRLTPFAGLDFHDSRQFFPMVTLLEVEGSISEKSILASLKAGGCSSKVLGFEAKDLERGIKSIALRRVETMRRAAARLYRGTISKRRKQGTAQSGQ